MSSDEFENDLQSSEYSKESEPRREEFILNSLSTPMEYAKWVSSDTHLKLSPNQKLYEFINYCCGLNIKDIPELEYLTKEICIEFLEEGWLDSIKSPLEYTSECLNDILLKLVDYVNVQIDSEFSSDPEGNWLQELINITTSTMSLVYGNSLTINASEEETFESIVKENLTNFCLSLANFIKSNRQGGLPTPEPA